MSWPTCARRTAPESESLGRVETWQLLGTPRENRSGLPCQSSHCQSSELAGGECPTRTHFSSHHGCRPERAQTKQTQMRSKTRTQRPDAHTHTYAHLHAHTRARKSDSPLSFSFVSTFFFFFIVFYFLISVFFGLHLIICCWCESL